VQLIAGLGLAIIAIMVVFWKEMKLVTFDPDFARANGYPLRWLEMLISSLLVVGLVMGLRVAGAILMLGVLVAPAVAARQWTNRLSIMVILAGIFGAFSGASGAVISGWDAAFPTGPFIIVIAFAFAVVSIAIAPGRGLLWRWWRQFSDRYRFAAQQVMRDLYRAIPANRPEFAISTQKLIALSGPTAPIGLKRLERKGLIRRCEECELFQSGQCPGCWLFTDQGLMAAQSDARNQRLWDCYRCYAHDLGLPLIAEDRQCDITALLTEDAVLRLEQLSD
jgi:MFS family permease